MPARASWMEAVVRDLFHDPSCLPAANLEVPSHWVFGDGARLVDQTTTRAAWIDAARAAGSR